MMGMNGIRRASSGIDFRARTHKAKGSKDTVSIGKCKDAQLRYSRLMLRRHPDGTAPVCWSVSVVDSLIGLRPDDCDGAMAIQ